MSKSGTLKISNSKFRISKAGTRNKIRSFTSSECQYLFLMRPSNLLNSAEVKALCRIYNFQINAGNPLLSSRLINRPNKVAYQIVN